MSQAGSPATEVVVLAGGTGGAKLARGMADVVGANGTVFFSARDNVHGIELWQSDGTAAGTSRASAGTATGGASTCPGRCRIAGWASLMRLSRRTTMSGLHLTSLALTWNRF